jgi:hypothetical protein
MLLANLDNILGIDKVVRKIEEQPYITAAATNNNPAAIPAMAPTPSTGSALEITLGEDVVGDVIGAVVAHGSAAY